MTEPNEQLIVSRDLLRAELGALELRLTERVAAEIAKKADTEYVRDLHHRVRQLEAAGPLGERIIAEFNTLKAEFDDVRMHGSHDARDALRLANGALAETERLKLWRSYLTGATALAIALGGFAFDIVLRRYL